MLRSTRLQHILDLLEPGVLALELGQVRLGLARRILEVQAHGPPA
jgi:hypothetical protein